jgi:hypothetical protein
VRRRCLGDAAARLCAVAGGGCMYQTRVIGSGAAYNTGDGPQSPMLKSGLSWGRTIPGTASADCSCCSRRCAASNSVSSVYSARLSSPANSCHRPPTVSVLPHPTPPRPATASCTLSWMRKSRRADLNAGKSAFSAKRLLTNARICVLAQCHGRPRPSVRASATAKVQQGVGLVRVRGRTGRTGPAWPLEGWGHESVRANALAELREGGAELGDKVLAQESLVGGARWWHGGRAPQRRLQTVLLDQMEHVRQHLRVQLECCKGGHPRTHPAVAPRQISTRRRRAGHSNTTKAAPRRTRLVVTVGQDDKQVLHDGQKVLLVKARSASGVRGTPLLHIVLHDAPTPGPPAAVVSVCCY